jgi:hypothetical protein
VVSLPRAYLHEPMLVTRWALGKFSDPAGFREAMRSWNRILYHPVANPPENDKVDESSVSRNLSAWASTRHVGQLKSPSPTLFEPFLVKVDCFRLACDTTTGPCVIIGQQHTTSGTTAIGGNTCPYRYDWLSGLSSSTIETE